MDEPWVGIQACVMPFTTSRLPEHGGLLCDLLRRSRPVHSFHEKRLSLMICDHWYRQHVVAFEALILNAARQKSRIEHTTSSWLVVISTLSPSQQPYMYTRLWQWFHYVSGGTAECVLASKLSEDPRTTVLLLERGMANHTWMSRILQINILSTTMEQ